MTKAIFLHCYYPEAMPSLIGALKAAPFEFNLYANLVFGHTDILAVHLKKHFPDAKINFFPNQGMDPGGQLRTLDYWLKNGGDEELLIFIHSKKNDSLRDLFSSIITSRAAASEQAFQDPTVGSKRMEPVPRQNVRRSD